MNHSHNVEINRFLKSFDRIAGNLGLQVPQIVKIEELRKLPPHTFGRAWADHLDTHQLVPFTTGTRRKQLHDGIHVLTGYGIDPMGEAEVQAFLLGTQFRIFNLLLLSGLVRLASQQFSESHSPIAIRQRLWKAYHRGRASTFNPDTWEPEPLLMLPLKAVQDRFSISRSEI